MKHADDMAHPLVDTFAAEYHTHLPRELWAAIGVPTDLAARPAVWWLDAPETRAAFRQVVRRFLAGDDALALWRLRAGLRY